MRTTIALAVAAVLLTACSPYSVAGLTWGSLVEPVMLAEFRLVFLIAATALVCLLWIALVFRSGSHGLHLLLMAGIVLMLAGIAIPAWTMVPV